jgi:SMC interacting uncharacterized protein involved in chromosome segregation
MTEEQIEQNEIVNEAENQTQQQTPPQKGKASPEEPSLLMRAIRWIFRMLVVVLLGIALGAGIYYGVRSIYRDTIEPLQTLDQRMMEIEATVSDLNGALRDERNSTAQQISGLQGRIAGQAEDIASLSAQISRLEIRIEGQGEALEAVTELNAGLEQLEKDLTSTDEQLQELQATVESDELPAEQVTVNLQLMRVMNLMTRARLWIEQDNFGLASEDLQTALEIMQPLASKESNDDQSQDQLQQITDQLTLVIETVRSNPVLAEEEMEIAWKLLLEATAP